MRLDNPRLPKTLGELVTTLSSWFSRLVTQLNGLAEGSIVAITNAATSVPTTGTYARGDFIRKSDATAAAAGYELHGWVCTVGGTPGTWVECRFLTADITAASITGLGSLATVSNLTGPITSVGAATTIAPSPTLTTPILGVAAATSINKVAITAPATSATLTIADGKTLTANNSLTLAGTDSTTMTFPTTTATIARTDAAQTFTGVQTFSSTIAGSINGNAATVTTNANLTGPITSSGNATAVASQTGTGTTFAMSVSPVFTGTVSAAALTTTGNTILGDAQADTLNVGNGDIIKDASGNVGIGTTPASASIRLHVYKTGGTLQTNWEGGTDAQDDGVLLWHYDSLRTGQAEKRIGWIGFFRDGPTATKRGGAFVFGTVADSSNVQVEKMRLTSTGLGIGMTPARALDVTGTFGATGAATVATATLTAVAPTVAAGQVGLGSTTATTVGAAGGASALPATPVGYLIVNIAGTARKIPFYTN